MRALSKSKLIAYRQCPKRLWLEIHHPELREESAATASGFAVGNRVGEVARALFDETSEGTLIDVGRDGYDGALARTKSLLKVGKPIFEAGFSAAGAIAFADIMLPVCKSTGDPGWRMVEVKSSTSIKDYHRDDASIQAFVARKAGVSLEGVFIAFVDKTWTYRGGNDYQGLLKEEDLTAETINREPEVMSWIGEAEGIAGKHSEPERPTGGHCTEPYECGFLAYCRRREPQSEYPINWLPQIRSKALKEAIDANGLIDLRYVPDDLLNETQKRVKAHTLSGEVYFDAAKAALALKRHKLPAYFLDFETISFAVPIWNGTRPYQSLPFQFSLHSISDAGKKSHSAFLDLSGNDPTKALAEALIAQCGEGGPIYVYSSFEKARITELAKRFPALKQPLLALSQRLVDLLPITKKHYYHPSQQGSWSIKKVLPAVAPDLRYDGLTGVKDGGMAMAAYVEAIAPETVPERREQIRLELLAYCGLDTLAMVRLWEVLAGRLPGEN
jgi:Domain of unknown function(DUF2779)